MSEIEIRLECLRIARSICDGYTPKQILEAAEELYGFVIGRTPAKAD